MIFICVSFFFLKLLMSLLGKPYMVFVNFENRCLVCVQIFFLF